MRHTSSSREVSEIQFPYDFIASHTSNKLKYIPHKLGNEQVNLCKREFNLAVRTSVCSSWARGCLNLKPDFDELETTPNEIPQLANRNPQLEMVIQQVGGEISESGRDTTT